MILGTHEINALTAGIIQGVGLSGAERGKNNLALSHYASRGYSVYFPAGDYEFSAKSTWSNHKGVKVWGENARLYQVSDGTRLLEFIDCEDTDVEGLTLHGPYWQSASNTSDSDTVAMIFAQSCDDLRIANNLLKGNAGHAVSIVSGNQLSILDNRFRFGIFPSGGSSSADIKIANNISGFPKPSEVIIRGNQLNTNTLTGIQCLIPTRNLICSDNIVITTDLNGDEVTDYQLNMRKSCIELQYHTGAANGNSNTDNSEHEMIVSGNKVQGCRYGAISFQSSQMTDGNAGGIRGTIANNQIRYCGLEQAGGVANYVQGGIVVNQYRDLVIQGNVIKNSVMSSASEGSAAIHCQTTHDRSIKGAGGTLSSLVISDNIITDSTSLGIRLLDGGDTIVANNILRDVVERNLYSVKTTAGTPERSGQFTLTGNRFVSELNNVAATRVEVGGPVRDMTICDNHLEFTGTWSTANYAMRIYGKTKRITGNRLIGPGGGTTGNGLYLDQGGDPGIRYEDIVLANNSISGFNWAMRGHSTALTEGPLLYNNCAFSGNSSNDGGWGNMLYAGHWVNRGSGPAKAVIYIEDNPPTGGHWNAGDLAWNINASSGQPMGWICTGGGNPGTWTPLANVP